MIVGYARVSRDRQDPATQMREVERVAAARGWTIARWYTDHGESGAKLSRPALNDMLADVRRGLVKVLVVYKVDRLGRNAGHMALMIDELVARGVDLVSATEPLDTTTSVGRLQIGIISLFAQYERELIRERVLAGQRKAKAQGKIIGRKPKPMDLDRAIALRRAGRSWRSIAKGLKVKMPTVRRRVLAAAGGDPAPGRDDGPTAVSKVSQRLSFGGIGPDAALGRQ
jgi:DNA invertase Pin-like site-specific DNA recombinase